MSAVRVISTAAGVASLALCAGCGATGTGAPVDASAPAGSVARTPAGSVARTPAGNHPRVAGRQGLVPTPIRSRPGIRPAARGAPPRGPAGAPCGPAPGPVGGLRGNQAG